MKWLEVLQVRYESLPIKIKLFIGMLIAANTAGMAIYFALLLAVGETDYWGCMGSFLAVRVYLFMANPSLPLTDENVAFMSSERILWNLATIAACAVVIPIKLLLN